MTEDVCCRACGYLSARQGVGLIEPPDADGHRDGKTGTVLLCLMRQSEFSRNPEAIAKQRDCGEFTEWVQGFTPKEHYEMNVMERLRAADLERQKSDREWRDRREELDRQWRREDVSLAKTNLFVAAGIGFISALATLIAAKLLPWFSPPT